MLGYHLEELAPLDFNTWVKLTHPEDLERCQAQLEQHFSGTLAYYNSILRMRHKAGHWVWINARGGLVKRTPEGLPLLMYGTHIDVSASHQQDEEVRRTRAFLQAVVDSSTEVAMIATDPNGLITLFNSGAERLLGYTSAAMVGQQTPAIFHLPSEVEARAAELSQQLGRPINNFELFIEKTSAQTATADIWTYVRQDGQLRQVNLAVTCIRDEHQQISGYLGIATDISTQLQVSRALQDNEQRLRSMISNLPGAVYRCRNDGNWSILHISDEIERLTGYPASDFTTQQRSLSSIILPSDLPVTRTAQNCLADGQVFAVNYRIRHADGHTVWISEKGRGAYADTGELLWLDGFLWDISANVAAEQERREREDYVHTVLDNVIDGILTFSPQGLIESCNRAAERIFALDPAHTLGLNAASLLAEPHRHAYRQHIRALLQEASEQTSDGLPQELEGLRQNGEHFPLELALSRISHRGEQKLIAVVRDITERKRVERMQSEFVSTVSHELRTPLTSIAGSLGLINGGALGAVPESMAAMLDIAQQNSQRLSLLINDLLDMEKLNAGHMRFDLQAYALRPLLEQALQANQAYADDYRVHWQLLDAAENAKVRVDAQRFLQVMANLLSNAAKHAPANSAVEIRSQVTEQQVRIEVRDYGSGIPEAFRARIFSKFAQADSSDRRQLGGTGLGLAISRELVERMHGQIGFSCEPGHGTCFWFSLPTADPT
jgi:PAS domain S-box-containing protein